MLQKKDGTIKSRFCADGSTQRNYVDREEATSPTAKLESMLITAVIEAKEQRDIMTSDVPNAFIQTECTNKEFT